MIPAEFGGRREIIQIRFRWPNEHQATLAKTLPLVLHAGRVHLVVAPGEPAELPLGRVIATAVVPGGAPLIAELAPVDHGLLEVPFPTSDVVRVAFGASVTEKDRSRVARGSLAFDVTRWADATAPIPEDAQVRIGREGDLLRLGGRKKTSAPLRLVLAGSSTPTRVIAVPRVAPDESAVIHVGFDRPWGARPTLTPSDDASRFLLAYLNAGEIRLAAAMARALARARADRDPIRWASPSFAQLLVGYAHALDKDAKALAGWCRRTQAARFLGTDGLILTAQSAWLLGRSRQATQLLARAEAVPPVMALGLEVAVRLAFHLAAEPRSAQVDFGRIEQEGQRLARLVTSYIRLAAATDPVADTVTTPTSERRPVSLEGRSWRQRAAWAIAYQLTRRRLGHTVKQSKGIMSVFVPLQKRAKQALDHRGGTVRRKWDNLLWLLAVPVILAWLGVLAAAVYFASSEQSIAWERLLPVLLVVQAGVFTLLGAGIALVALERRSAELAERVYDSQRRVRLAEEEAMKGRALAAALQAEASSAAASDSPAGRHALLSQALFGEMIGHDMPPRDAPDSDRQDPTLPPLDRP